MFFASRLPRFGWLGSMVGLLCALGGQASAADLEQEFPPSRWGVTGTSHLGFDGSGAVFASASVGARFAVLEPSRAALRPNLAVSVLVGGESGQLVASPESDTQPGAGRAVTVTARVELLVARPYRMLTPYVTSYAFATGRLLPASGATRLRFGVGASFNLFAAVGWTQKNAHALAPVAERLWGTEEDPSGGLFPRFNLTGAAVAFGLPLDLLAIAAGTAIAALSLVLPIVSVQLGWDVGEPGRAPVFNAMVGGGF